MKNKKGFTLTELLAVLVLLAIIALIVVPIVLGDIYKSRENAHKRSIENYGREVEKAYVEAKMNKGSIPTTLSEMKDLIKYSGDTVTCDEDKIILINDKIELYNCYVGDETKQKSKHKYNYIDGKLEEVVNEKQDDKTYKEYSIGDEPIQDKTNGEDYYVIANSDSTQDYVVALKAEPLTVDEVNTYGNGHVNIYNTRSGDSDYHQAYNSNGYGGMAYYTGPNCGINPYYTEAECLHEYSKSEVKYVVDNWSSSKLNGCLKDVDGYSARLIKLEELLNLGYSNEPVRFCEYEWCNNYYQYKPMDEQPDWVKPKSYDYWIMSQSSTTNNVMLVHSDGTINLGGVSTFSGRNDVTVRPVINLRKEFIK